MSIKYRLVKTIADARNIEPSELDYPLYEYIDVDAIERMIHHETGTWTLTFDLPECTVTITNTNKTVITCESRDERESGQAGTQTEVLGHCPACETAFERADKSGDRYGYVLLGKGNEIALIRCENCDTELPVPEADDKTRFGQVLPAGVQRG